MTGQSVVSGWRTLDDLIAPAFGGQPTNFFICGPANQQKGTSGMSKMLENKVALVTGAGRGIGREIAMMMAAHGAKVVVNDPGVSLEGNDESDAPARDVVREITSAGGEAIADFGSVSDPASAREMVGAAVEKFGKIDVVVDDAGVLRDRLLPQDERRVNGMP